MPELLPTGPGARLRRLAPLFAGALALCCVAVPATSHADTVPASLRACTAESDPGLRLACYDREMKRATPASGQRPVAAESAAASAPAAVPAPAAQTQSAPPAAAVTASQETPAPQHTPAWKKILTGGPPWHLTAHVASLDRSPDAMVLHLDNGQVWQQMAPVSGELSLHAGASVTIEKHLGSYWLSSRYVSNMKVRQQSQ